MRKLLSLLIILSILPCAVVSAEETETAYAIFGANGAQVSNAVITTGMENSFDAETVSGREAWKLGTSGSENCFINIDISEPADSEYENYRLEVTYLDSGNGHFFVRYHKKGGAEELEPIISENSGEWKTASLYLPKAAFKNGITTSAGGKCDIVLSTNRWTTYSLSPMHISEVRLTDLKTEDRSDIVVKSTPNELTFSDGDAQSIAYSVDNPLYKRLEGTMTVSVTDEDGSVIGKNEEAVSISANGRLNKTLSLDVKKYGVHTIKLAFSAPTDGIYSEKECEISLSRKSAAKKDGFGISAHLYESHVQSTIPLLSDMGTKMLRDECFWKDYEKEKGVYKLDDNYVNYIDEAVSQGIEPLIILDFGNKLYTGSDSDYPKTDTQIAAYGEYVYHLVSDLKGKVQYFEVWNEFETSGSGAEYAKILKTAYTRAKAANPNVKIIGLAAAGVNVNYLDELLAAEPNIGNYMDLISFHLYAMGNSPESKYFTTQMNYSIRELKNRFADKEIWLTEMGWSESEKSGNPKIKTDGTRISESQAAKYAVRCILRNDAEWKFSHIFDYTWNDSHDNFLEREANFGKLNSDLSAKKSYVAYAAMNSFIGGGQLDERVVDSDNNYIQSYTVGEDKKVSVIFNADDKKSRVYVQPDYEACTFYDMYGNLLAPGEENGAYLIETDGEPIYMIETRDAAYMHYATNTANIHGKIEGAQSGSQIMLYVLKPGADAGDILDVNSLAYIAQATVGESGAYEFSFPMTDSEGDYKIYIGYKKADNLLGPITLRVKRSISGKISLYRGDKEIKTLSELLAAEGNISVKGIINNKYNVAADVSVYAAGYDKDKNMTWAGAADGRIDKFGSNEILLDVDEVQVLDNGEIKVFLWTDSQKPIVMDLLK